MLTQWSSKPSDVGWNPTHPTINITRLLGSMDLDKIHAFFLAPINNFINYLRSL